MAAQAPVKAPNALPPGLLPENLGRKIDQLYLQSPIARWQYVDVEFPTANVDVDIPHLLRPQDPEEVRWIVVLNNTTTVIAKDTSATRKPWQQSHIWLRAECPCTARILLYLERESSQLARAITAMSPGGDCSGSGGGDCCTGCVTLTIPNSEILTLPSTPIDLVAAPGLGFFTDLISVTLIKHGTAGGYVGLDATYAALAVTVPSGFQLTTAVVDDATLTSPITNLTRFLANADDRIIRLNVPDLEARDNAGGASGFEWVQTEQTDLSEVENQPVQLTLDNNGVVTDLTGGDGENCLTIITCYITREIPVCIPEGENACGNLLTLMIPDEKHVNGAARVNATTGAIIATGITSPRTGEGGAILVASGTLCIGTVTSGTQITSVAIYDNDLTAIATGIVPSGYDTTHWHNNSPIANTLNSFWVGWLDDTFANFTKVAPVSALGVAGTVQTLDLKRVQTLGANEAGTRLYYADAPVNSALRSWDTGAVATLGDLIAAPGALLQWKPDIMYVPGTNTFLVAVGPLTLGGVSAVGPYEVRLYQDDGTLLRTFALPDSCETGGFPIRLALDVDKPSTAFWVRTFVDPTGATTEFTRFLIADGSTLDSFSGIAQNNLGTAVPFSCPFYTNCYTV